MRQEDERLRILMVTARFHPFTGGTEIHTREVSRRLAAAGHSVTVLTADASSSGNLAQHEQMEGFTVLRVKAWPRGSDLHFAPGVYRTIVGGGWDVIHIQGYHTLVPPLAMLAALRKGIPYVVTFHGGGHSSRLRQSVRGVQRALLAPLLSHAARLIALARFEIILFGDRLGIPRDRFVMIPNGTDLPPLPRSAQPRSEGVVIASVGRLERYKGHQRILAALPVILREVPNARLWIAGAGPYESTLRKMAVQLGVSDRVDIRAIPPAEREALALELSQVALVVLLSEYETQPIAVLEGLSLGRPALVADTSGLSELAERGLARAIPLASSPEQVAAAVLAQLRAPLVPRELQLPSWDECAASLGALYATVVSGSLDPHGDATGAPAG
jgi:glycosyltransferase involved in cell wall biosynthesis